MISPYRRRRVIADGQDAAASLRKQIRAAGEATCAACGLRMLPSAVDIDHVIPLCAGGSDTPDNVQVLCREVCHKAKTRRDMGYAKAPF